VGKPTIAEMLDAATRQIEDRPPLHADGRSMETTDGTALVWGPLIVSLLLEIHGMVQGWDGYRVRPRTLGTDEDAEPTRHADAESSSIASDGSTT
jgi:hypothetical protein